MDLSSAPDLIEQALSINVVEQEREFRRKRNDMVRQRFFAGLMQTLQAMPQVDGVYISFIPELLVAVSPIEDVRLYGELVRGGAREKKMVDPQVWELCRAFHKKMGPTRAAVGPGGDTIVALRQALPPGQRAQDNTPAYAFLPTALAQRLCVEIVKNPSLVFAPHDLDAWLIRQSTPEAASSHPRPRI